MLKHDTKNNIRIRSPRFGKLSVGHRDQREKSPDFSEVLLLLIFMGIFFVFLFMLEVTFIKNFEFSRSYFQQNSWDTIEKFHNSGYLVFYIIVLKKL